MGTFTVLGATELAELAEVFRLGELREHRTIAAGTINSNFEIVTETGRYFLRVNEGKSEADVAWESRLVIALADEGVIAPAPLASRDGKPWAPLAGDGPTKWVSVFPWRDGTHLAAPDVTQDLASTFGGALARLHQVGLELPADWRRGSIYDHDHLVARFEQRIDRVNDAALAHAKQILRDELEVASNATPLRKRATHGIIHGDLFRDNVLWQRDRITAILDFEQASGGSLAYDLAVCINDWCWSEGPRLDIARALIGGYERVRPLTDGDRAALPYEIRAAAMRFTITRITDVYLARVTNPEKDFRAFLARVEAWRGPSLGQLTATL